MNSDAEPMPDALAVIPENIPAELRARPQWVCWRWELRDGNPTKPPYQTNGRKAKSNDSKTWTTFEEVLAAYQAGEFSGVGYCLTDDEPFTLGDVDDCRDPVTGVVAPWAAELLAGWSSYAELSPSATGLRTVGRGKKPGTQCGPKKYRGGKIEMYDRSTNKYLTFTGHRLPDTPAVITDAQEHITRIYAAVFPEPGKAEQPGTDRRPGPKPSANGKQQKSGKRTGPWGKPYAELSDDDLLTLAREAKNGEKFSALFDDGNPACKDGDDSRADASLCALLAFWCRKDGDRVDRLFRRSKLYRDEKWDKRHRADGSSYGQMTIEFAVANCKEVYDPGIRVRMKGAGNKPTAEDGPPGDDSSGTASGSPDWPPPAVIVLREWLRDKYQPTFRRGAKLYSATLGREIALSEVSSAPTSEVLALLGVEPDAPTVRGTRATDTSQLPKHYKTWLPVAWGDISFGLPEEAESSEVVEPAREEFIRGLTAALVTMVPLSYRHNTDGAVEEVQRRPVIEWARMFAKVPRWESVRGYRIWARKDATAVRIAIRAELLGQVHARGLDGLAQKRLSELCVLYGIGTPCHIQGGQARATELTAEFLADLFAGPADPDGQTGAGETRASACEGAS